MKNMLLVPIEKTQEMVDRLDVLKGNSSHYTQPIFPCNPPDYPYVLFFLDDNPGLSSVLTLSELESRLEVIPDQFKPPLPE